MNENKGFTLEDILREERDRREAIQSGKLPLEGTMPKAPEDPDGETPPEERPAAGEEAPAEAEAPAPEEISVPEEVSAPEEAASPDEDTADLNAFATGNFPAVDGEGGQQTFFAPEEPAEGGKGKKKKKRRGLFGRKKVPEFDEGDDLYYGLQLKPIDEYRKGFDPVTGEFTLSENGYESLFDDSKKAIDDEVEANFHRLQQERRRRVAEAVQNAGVDAEEIASEFGVVAPMPVTAFAADPYVKDHGVEVEASQRAQENLPDFQKAMLQTSQDQNLEVKLNVESDTMELHRAAEEQPPVSEETVSRILESEEPQEDTAPPVTFETAPESAPVAAPPQFEELSSGRAEEAPEEAFEEEVSEAEEIPEADLPEAEAHAPRTVIEGREPETPPQVGSIYEYRPRGIPTHIINVDVMQSALLSESEDLLREEAGAGGKSAYRRRRLHRGGDEEELPPSGGDPDEEIDDYTGPEDARSIAQELKGNMHALTLRLGITGVCTVLAALANVIFLGPMKAAEDGGAAAVVYVALSALFLGVCVAVCFRSVANGLKGMFLLKPSSDSAAAAAAVAVAVQTVFALFFRGDLAAGKVHLYAVVLCAILFLNTAGKLTMLRRIHSNFRFVASREQKYAARVYDDYNTALRLSKDCVAESPVIVYQNRVGFLRRFLELSYAPDVSEAASQTLAPVGLIASLTVCAVCLFVTQNVPMALSAFAAAACASVAAGNMLSVNVPVSRLCRTARRAGAMAVGYEAVEQFGGANAVLVDAEALFPRGTVVLNGIRTHGGRAAAEEAILLASAMMQEAGGPLSGVFDQVISENEDALPQVDGVSYESGGGIVGRVDGKTVYLGGRSLLVNHQIEVPSREEESQMASGNRQVIYIAVEDAIAATLTLTYTADRRRRNELMRMEQNGLSVIVRTNDPNVTAQLVSRLFGIDPNSVGVVDGELGDTAGALLEGGATRADAVVATKGRAESLMRVVSACVELRRSMGLIVAIQVAAVILGFVLVAFLACFGAMGRLPSWILFLFEGFWLLLTLLAPKLKR